MFFSAVQTVVPLVAQTDRRGLSNRPYAYPRKGATCASAQGKASMKKVLAPVHGQGPAERRWGCCCFFEFTLHDRRLQCQQMRLQWLCTSYAASVGGTVCAGFVGENDGGGRVDASHEPDETAQKLHCHILCVL